MEKIITETDGRKLVISTDNCDFVKLSVDGCSPYYVDNRKTINLSKRQVCKLITELQNIVVIEKEKIPKDFNPDNYIK
jgi:predicted nuclease of predicted toxin-antitoxin system